MDYLDGLEEEVRKIPWLTSAERPLTTGRLLLSGFE